MIITNGLQMIIIMLEGLDHNRPEQNRPDLGRIGTYWLGVYYRLETGIVLLDGTC